MKSQSRQRTARYNRLTMARHGFLLLALVGMCSAGPLNLPQDDRSTQCSSFCPMNTKYGFEPDKTYEYSYESDVKTHIPGATEEHSTLHMRATARLEVLSRCEMALQLSDVTLQDSNPGDETRKQNVVRTSEFRNALEKNALRFAFVSGNVEAVCPSESEETWVLNVKRAVLSSLQNGMNDFNTDFRSRETDVAGECPVQYQAMGAGWNGEHTIKKLKELQGCTSRHSADTVFQGTAYRTPSRMQSLPAMKGSHECVQKVNKHGILTESSCHESHIFRPFSRGDSGATTHVHTKLTFKREDDGVKNSEGLISVSKALLFEHELSEEESRLAGREAEETLRQLCARTTPDVQTNAPALFGQLVRQLRQVDTASLVNLHRTVRAGKYCSNADKYLHDAIPTVGSVASARLIKDLILSGEVSGAEEALWLNSLSFVQNPNAAILAEVTPLIKTRPLRRQAALAVSSLVNNFCRDNSRCGATREVQAIVEVFAANLADGCAGDHDMVLMSLKALGNTGHAETAVGKLNTCLNNDKIPMETRVAAVQAFRRMACTADRTTITALYENSEVDAELRINAYLALMSCPTDDVIRRIRVVLEREEVNQVGSFVWTHLTNLMESSSPMKQEIRQILDSQSLRGEFDMDKRKFSRNIEWSTFAETLNSGASVDSNIIWSEKSFVPRSASVNLTVDLFGHSVNLVEVGGRVEGLNQVLENIFDSNTPAEKSKSSNKAINNIDAKFGAKKEELHGSGYIRIFGNEIAYADLDSLDMSTLKEKFNYLNWLVELAKERDVEFSKSIQFLDTSLNIPTMAGFPLRLHVTGNAVTDIKMKGKLDVKSLLSTPRALTIDGSIAPSAAVEVSAQMGVYTFGARTGVIMVNTMHTSTVADGKILFREGKMVNVDLNMPRDRLEIFKAQHKFYVVHRETTREQRMKGARLEYSRCLGDTFSKVTGLDVCGQVSFPSGLSTPDGPWAPLTTPSTVSLTLTKKDTFTKYHFEAGVTTAKTEHDGHTDVTDSFKVSFNTPGSRIDREMTVDTSWNRAHEAVLVNLRCPWKKVDLRGALVRNNDLKRLSASAIIDDETRYSTTAEVQIEKNTYNTRYVPMVEVSLPGRDPITLTGSVLYRPMKKINVDLRLENAFTQPVTAKGAITLMSKKERNRFETSFDIKSAALTGKVNGFVDRTVSSNIVYSSRLQVEYVLAGSEQERIAFSNKLRDASTNTKKQYALTSSFSNTMWPKWDFDVNTELSLDGNKMSSSLEASISGSKRKTITITQTGSLSLMTPTKTASLGITFACPYKRMTYEVKMDHEQQANKIKSLATMMSGSRRVGLLDIDMEKKDPVRRMDVKLQYPGREMALQASSQDGNNGQKHFEASLQLQKGQVIRAVSDYKRGEGHELTTDITTPFTEPLHVSGVIKPEMSDFKAKADVDYRDQRYSADAAFSFTGHRNNFKTASSLQVAYPSRTVKVGVSLGRKWKTFEAAVETQWDRGQKVSITGELTAAPFAPSLTLRAEWPQRFAELTASGKFEQGSSWSPFVCHLEGKLNFRSSFETFENIASSIKYDHVSGQVTASTSLSWDPEKKINAVVNLNKKDVDVDFSAKLTTPFEQVRRAIYTFTSSSSRSRFTAKTKAQLNAQQISFDITSNGNLPNVDVMATLRTPLPKYRELTLTAKHAYRSGILQAEGDFTWAPGRKVAANLNIQHSITGRGVNNVGELRITTPFAPYRTSQLSWDHSLQDGVIKTHLESNFRNAKSISDFEAGVTVEDPERTIYTKYSTSGPYANLQLNLKHSHNLYNLRNVKSSGTIQWQNQKTITVNNEFTIDRQTFQESLKLTGPFDPVTLKMDNRLVHTSFTGKNELKWGENQQLALEAEIAVEGRDVDGTAQLSSSFFNTQKVVINNKFAKGVWISSGRYEYAAERAVEVTTKVGLGKTKTLYAEVKSECPYLKSAYIDLSHTGNIKDFSTRFVLFHHLLREKIRFNSRLDVANLRDIKVNSYLSTPFRNIRTLRAVIAHKHEDGNIITSSATFQLMKYKVRLSNEMTLTSLKQFNTKTIIEYRPQEKIQFSTDFDASSTIKGKVTFQSPLAGLEDIAVTFSHQGHAKNFKTSAEVSLDNTRKITGGIEFEVAQGIKALAFAATPFSGYKSMGLTLNIEGKINDFKQSWSAYKETSRMGGENVVTVRSGDVNVRSSMQTPFAGYENIIWTFRHSGNLYHFNHDALLEYPGSRFHMSNSFNLAEGRLTAVSALQTPYRGLREFNMEVTHEGSASNFKNAATATVNGAKYEAGSTLQVNSGAVQGNLFFRGPEEYSITFTHSGRLADFNNEVTIAFNGRNIKGESKFKLTNWKLEGSANLLTPFRGYEKFSIETSTRGRRTNFQCVHKAEMFGHQVSIEDTFKLGRGELAASLKITSTFEEMAKFILSFNHQGSWTDFENTGSVVFNEDRYSGSSQFRLVGNSASGTASLEEYTIKFKHEGSATDFANDLTVTSRKREVITGGSKFKLTDSSIEGSARLLTPFRGYEKFVIESSSRGHLNNFECEHTLEAFGRQFSLTDKFRLTDSSVEGSATLLTPFRGYEKFVIESSSRGHLNNFECEHTLEAFGHQFSLTDKFRLTDSSLEGSATLLTPFRGYEKFAIESSTHGHLNNFKCEHVAEMFGHKVSLTDNFKLTDSSIEGSATLLTTFKGYEKFVFESSTHGHLTNFQCEHKVEMFDHRIGLTDMFRKTNDEIVASAKITSTFEQMETLILNFNHKGPWTNFQNSGSLVINGHRYVGSSEFALAESEVSGRASLLIPEEYIITFKHKGPVTDYTNELTVKMGDKTFSAESTVKLTETGFQVLVSVLTPFPSTRTFELKFSHDGPLDDFKQEGTFKSGSDIYAFSNMFEGRDSLKAAMKLTTPHSELSDLNIDITHQGKKNNFRNNIDVIFNGRKYNGNSQFKMFRTNLKAMAKVKLAEEYGILMKHKGGLNDFGNSLHIDFAGQKINVNSAFTNEKNKIDAELNIVTPFDNFEKATMKFSHTGEWREFQTSAQIQTSLPGYRNFAFATNFVMTGNDVQASGSLVTPFRFMRNVEVNVHHSGTPTDFQSEFTVNHNRETLKGVMAFRMTRQSIVSTGSIETSTRKYAYTFNHNGHLYDFTTTLRLEGPFQDWSFVQGALIHKGTLNDFASSAYIDYTGGRIGGKATFKNLDKIEGSFEIETPLHTEKFELVLHHQFRRGDIKASGTLTTPFSSWKTMGFDLSHEGSLRNFQSSVLVNGPQRSAKAKISHNLSDGMSTTGSLEFGEHRANVAVTFKQNARSIDLAASLETTVPEADRFAVTFHHEKTPSGFTTTGRIDHPFPRYSKPSFQVDLKRTSSLFQLTSMVVTACKHMDPINVNVVYKGSADDFSLTSTLEGLGHTVNTNTVFNYGYQNGIGNSQATGTVTTTFQGFERFGFTFRNTKTVEKCVTMGNIELPFTAFEDPSFEITYSKNSRGGTLNAVITTPFKRVSPLKVNVNYEGSFRSGLTASGNVEVNRRRFAFKTEMKRSATLNEMSGSLETPFDGFDRFDFKMDHRKETGLQRMSLSLDIPFTAYENPSIIIEKRERTGDLSAMLKIVTPFRSMSPITLNVQHQGNVNDFGCNVVIEYGSRKGVGNVNFKNAGGNIIFSSSVETPFKEFDKFGLKFTHRRTSNGFATSGGLETPFKQYEDPEFELSLEGNPRNFRSSLKLTTPFKSITPVSVNFDHRGELNDFHTNGALEYNGQRISLNGAFEKVRANMKLTVALQTSFRNYERFALVLNHNDNGRIIKTTGNIEIPFRGYARPSFEFRHRGGREDFTTTGKLVTPFIHVQPITFAINHKGENLKNFESNANVQYNGHTVSGQGSFKVVNGKIVANGLVQTPFRNAERLGFTLEHQNDDRQINTKATIETPHRQYRNFGLEINHHGTPENFVLLGKVQTPFRSLTTVNFRLSHKGRLTDFKTSGFIETEGKKIETEVEYKKGSGWLEADHEGTIRFATPFDVIRQVEVAVTQAYANDQWTGNVKGSYNSKEFDADYILTNRANKAITLTVREPRSMLFKTTINPSKATVNGLFNWDTRAMNKNVRFEGSLKNEVKARSVDREVSFKAHLPTRVVGVTTGYELSQGKFNHKANIQWDNARDAMLNYEVEVSKNEQSRPYVYDGRLKLSSPFGNFETTANHRVNLGRRYLTEINIITKERLTIRSDVTPTMPNFRGSVTINHPHFSKEIVFGVEGKIDRLAYDGKIDVQYGREKMEFTGKIADKSDSSQMRYIAEASMKHPGSEFDFSFKSDMESNKNVLSGNIKVVYLMARDRLMKTLTLRTEINKLREELQFQVLTPMKNIRLNGRRTLKDSTRQHFQVAGTLDERSVSAEIDVDRTLPSFGMALNYAPESSLHMYGKYLDHNNVKFEAYRQELGTRTTETELNLELANGHLLKARAFIQPNLLHDLIGLLQEGSSVRTFLSEVTSVLEEEFTLRMKSLSRALSPIARGLMDMYTHNDYYLKDMTDATKDAFTSAVNQVGPVMQAARDLAKDYMREVQRVLADTYSRTSQQIANLSEQAQEAASRHLSSIHGSLYDMVDNIRRNPRTQHLLNLIQNKMERVVARITDLADMAKETVEGIVARPELEPVRRWFDKISKKSAWIYEYLQLEENARAFLHHLRETGFGPLRKAAWSTARTYLHLEETKINSWIPERGEFSGQAYIPFILQDLRSMPTINIRQYINKVKSYLPETDWVFWDTLYAYKPTTNFRAWIPPFNAHATLAGTQHYMTFDKRFYEYSGQCSYLLARDFIDGTFSVIVNYDVKRSGIQKSLTVIHGDTQVEIKPAQYRIELNGRRTELPITTEHTAIYRVGNTLRVDNDHGVTILCDLPHDRCTVSVTGWYFGKTAGLLGTYDNEPATDFTTSSGTRVTRPEALADSWTVGRRCRAVNRADDREPLPSSPNFDKCANYFKSDNSPFRPCFKQVEPVPFMKMCVNDNPCNVAAFYIDECGRKGVPIRMPADCVKCTMPDGSQVTEDSESTTIEGAAVPKEADVVLVVSHGACNEKTVQRLPDIAKTLEKSLKAAGVKKVHFGLVAYAGEGREIRPHSHTLDGQLLNTKTAFAQSLGTFTTTSEDSGDEALSAIDFATSYPFHTGASKTVVLVPCADCTEQGAMYSDVQAALVNRDIMFHVLLQHDFQLKGQTKSPKTSYMFGLDRKGAFTSKHMGVSDLRGDPDLRRQMALPKDLCVALTHETDGAVFNLLKLIEARKFVEKRFLDVAGRVMAKKGAPSECQICECRADETGTGMTSCRSCQPRMDWASFVAQDLPEVPTPFKAQKKMKRRN